MISPIEFDVLWWDDNQSQLNDLGVRPDIIECSTRKVTFYNIDAIFPYFEKDSEFCTIWSSGQEYVVKITYEKVKQLLA